MDRNTNPLASNTFHMHFNGVVIGLEFTGSLKDTKHLARGLVV